MMDLINTYINDYLYLYQLIKATLEGLPGGQVLKIAVKVLVAVSVTFVTVWAIERFHNTRSSHYRSVNFLHDLAYTIYYRSGIGRLFTLGLIGVVVYWVEPVLQVLEWNLLDEIPMIPRLLIWLVIADFINYWVHRLQHTNSFLWAFHSTHHSQEELTFASAGRFHPLDNFNTTLLFLIPAAILGARPENLIPVSIVLSISVALQHTQVPWRLGPFYRVFVTPHFHSFHHSKSSPHSNFGGFFSVWDYMFGTVKTAEHPAQDLGLIDITHPTLMSSLYMPFVMLYRQYIQPLNRLAPSQVNYGKPRTDNDSPL